MTLCLALIFSFLYCYFKYKEFALVELMSRDSPLTYGSFMVQQDLTVILHEVMSPEILVGNSAIWSI